MRWLVGNWIAGLLLAAGYTLPSQLKYNANITGSVTRKTADKEGDILSVKDLGCVGDGVADDTACLNNAIGLASSGTKVYAPCGTYHITGAINSGALGSNVVFEGAGLCSNLALDTASAYIRPGAQWTIRGFKVSSSQTTINPFASIYCQSTADVVIEDIEFSGGGAHILMDTCTNFRVRNTRHQTLTAPSHVLFVFNSDHGEIIGTRIDSFTYPISASAFRGIEVQNSSYIQVTDPIVNGVDATNTAGFAGVSFAGSNNCNLTGGVFNGNKNADGVATEQLSSDIAIVGTTSTGNGSGAGAGSTGAVGDGFDIYNSARIKISGCTARNNGTWTANRHPGIEIFSSQDVTVENCDASDNGLHGIALVGSQRTKLIGVTAQRNAYAGLNSQAGTSTVSTNGTAVTWISGQIFGAYAANTTILINSVAYLVASVTDTTHLVLTTTAGVQASVAMQVDPVGTQIIGGHYSENAVANSGTPGQMEGMYFANGSTVNIIGAYATDTRSPKLQTYGVRLENTSRATMVGNNFRGNLSASVLDSVATSVTWNDDTNNLIMNVKAGQAMIPQVNTQPMLQLGPTNPIAMLGLILQRVTPTYGTTVAINAQSGNEFVVTPTDGVAFAVSAPTNPQTGQRITFRVKNTFGVLGAITMNAVFKFVGAPTFPVVANGTSQSIDFQYDGTNWIQASPVTGAVPN